MRPTQISAVRYHDISCGHRVAGHESKCAHLHGHNYRIHFHCRPVAGLDVLGRVLDFGVIKETLCDWLEQQWDHRFIYWTGDPVMSQVVELMPQPNRSIAGYHDFDLASCSFVPVPFNPTAENMALFLLHEVAPRLLHDKPVEVYRVVVDETRKCSAGAELLPR